MLTVRRLNAVSVKPFLLFTAPGLRHSLLGDAWPPEWIVFGATFWGEPAGAAVAYLGNDTLRLIDLYVLPCYRLAGIGTGLLRAMEEEAKQAGAGTVSALYRPDGHSPALEALLGRAGWTSPTLRHWLFWTRCSSGFNSWVTRYRFRAPYEVVSWPDVTERERETIAERGAEGWYPADLSPFHRPVSDLDPVCSVGLRRDDQIVGWVLCVREMPEQLLVETMFVDPPLQQLGRGFILAGEVFRRYCSSAGGSDYFYCRVSAENEPMLRWTRRAFADRMVDEYAEWYSEKVLAHFLPPL